MSGFSPSFVKGMSASGITKPTVPFCPQRDANLSPKLGIRTSRTRTFAMRCPSSLSVMKVLSTIPNCPFFGFLDISTNGLLGDLLYVPIMMVFSSTAVFSFINPYLSS